MAHTKKDSSKKKDTHPSIKDQIIEKISAALEEFKAEWGEKNFKRKIKKAGKLLSGGTKKKVTSAKPAKPVQAIKPATSTIKKVAAAKPKITPKPQAAAKPKTTQKKAARKTAKAR